MKVFALFLMMCFVGGILAARFHIKRVGWLLIILCLGVVFAYFFLHKI